MKTEDVSLELFKGQMTSTTVHIISSDSEEEENEEGQRVEEKRREEVAGVLTSIIEAVVETSEIHEKEGK